MGITYSECVFVILLIQRAKRLRPVILPSICHILSTFAQFPGRKLLNVKRVFCFSLPLLFETLPILRNESTYDQKCVLVFM